MRPSFIALAVARAYDGYTMLRPMCSGRAYRGAGGPFKAHREAYHWGPRCGFWGQRG